MRRVLLILILLLPSVAQAGVIRAVTQAYADANYLQLSGGTITGELVTSVGTFESTVADGTPGFILDVSNAHTSGNLFEVREAGGTTKFYIDAAQATQIGGTLSVRSSLQNTSSTSACTDSNGSVCVLDNFQLDGIFYTEETTTPSAVANYGALYTKSDNHLYFQDGAGVEHQVGLEATHTIMGYDVDNTDAFVVNANDEWHYYHTNGGTSANANGWTFDGGGAGTSHAISSIADAGGGDITVTTGTSHLLAVGDYVSQTGLTDAAYVGTFEVLTVPTGTTYTVTAVYTATDTGTMDQASCLIPSANSSGLYHIAWAASATSQTNNEVFDWAIYHNETKATGGEMRRKFGTGGDYGVMGASVFVDVTAGDCIGFGLKNITGTGNTTIRYITFTVHQI